jgi:hypothetical protein
LDFAVRRGQDTPAGFAVGCGDDKHGITPFMECLHV